MGSLSLAHSFALDDLQKNAWLYEVRFLRRVNGFDDAYVLFEYTIPRMGKRVDTVLIHLGTVFVVEFKVGQSIYHQSDLEQVLDYSLDLKNFHHASHDVPIVPILLATEAPSFENDLSIYSDQIWSPLRANPTTFGTLIKQALYRSSNRRIDPISWESSEYRPTPTIIEAAQALYRGHGVKEISRSDAANLGETTDAISRIIDQAKTLQKKAICFLTGVPGAGKTLAGLNLATERQRLDQNEHAVFLSGNGPLVHVLQEALARYEASDEGIRKSEALSRTRAFIQNIHHFRDDALTSGNPPVEKVAIFDEAQRAWTLEQTRRFMAQKKGVPDFAKSEPEFLIEIMDRHQDWAVIICLVGGGQEINTGEAGLPEWFRTLGARFSHWDVHISDRLTEYEFGRGDNLYTEINPNKLKADSRLHLATSIRSFRSEKLSSFIKALLDLDVETARGLKKDLDGKYPIVLTRDLAKAKSWIRSQARGSERFGLVASSGGHRLRPSGITVKVKVDPVHWFLNPPTDVRSSYYLEEAATEFDIQGLELDWTVVGWDGDLRYDGSTWQYSSFRGTEWQEIGDPIRRFYLKNAYRVLLTRARQGMVIFIPEGDPLDLTREPVYYDGTYRYLRELGIVDIGETEQPAAPDFQ